MVVADNFLYVSNVLDGTLSGYSIAPNTGILTPLSGSPFAIAPPPLRRRSVGSILYAVGCNRKAA